LKARKKKPTARVERSSAEAALKSWKPKEKQAKAWLKGMRSARVGGRAYLQRLQRQIHGGLKV
jgi:hypothetical protein